jgi:hypothetical protein
VGLLAGLATVFVVVQLLQRRCLIIPTHAFATAVSEAKHAPASTCGMCSAYSVPRPHCKDVGCNTIQVYAQQTVMIPCPGRRVASSELSF